MGWPVHAAPTMNRPCPKRARLNLKVELAMDPLDLGRVTTMMIVCVAMLSIFWLSTTMENVGRLSSAQDRKKGNMRIYPRCYEYSL